ncbi:MAG: hypothetical protein GC149_03625 [Gammaproteobacteria bacterium]|nr:hypothetical protein [Gammaproteobacteria bacterium]
MNTYIALFLIAWVISLVGYLWLAFTAFKRSVLWGVLVLLLSPITAIVYAMLNWFDARKAFVVFMLGFLGTVGSLVYITGQVGVGNMQEIATRMHSGKLMPAKAYQLIAKALGPSRPADLFAEEKAPTTAVAAADAAPMPVSEAELAQTGQKLAAATTTPAVADAVAKPAVNKADAPAPVKQEDAAKSAKDATATAEVKQDATKTDAGKKEEKPEQKVPNLKSVQPDPLAQKPKKPEPNTVVVSLAKMPGYTGHYFIITLKTGNERRGLLRKVDENYLILDRKLYGGNLQYKIRKSEIKSIHMLTRLPDER